ncbi:MAG TPA: dTMP kinase [Candidatus Scybalomonas excrementigallinarum]|nr:dTMP kinase [Candidatus Scybalomonas excrementigallinarum]
MRGILISVEGPDGAGKTTQITLLKKYLEKKGYDSIVTREPGGTNISEKIRSLILDRENIEMGRETEMLLYAAARAQLVHEVIKPALEQGKAVICDRYVDSSAVYQGIARGLGIETVYEVNQYAIQGILPDLTIHLDLNAEDGIRRKKDQAELDRMELETMEFHKKVADGYRQLAKRAPERMKTIDATLPIEEIQERIIQFVENMLSLEK